MSTELLTEIQRFVTLQAMLVAEFRTAFPKVSDFEYLTDAPKTGCLVTERGLWLFRRHGVGYSFVNAQGVWIDVHDNFGFPDLFDAWRLQLYLESVGMDEFDLESQLPKLADCRKLLRSWDQLYRLPEVPPNVAFKYGVEDLRPARLGGPGLKFE